MNRILWAGLLVMAAAVLFYLGFLLTTFLRPMLTGVAIIGALLFIGGIAIEIVQRNRAKEVSRSVG